MDEQGPEVADPVQEHHELEVVSHRVDRPEGDPGGHEQHERARYL